MCFLSNLKLNLFFSSRIKSHRVYPVRFATSGSKAGIPLCVIQPKFIDFNVEKRLLRQNLNLLITFGVFTTHTLKASPEIILRKSLKKMVFNAFPMGF